MSISGETSRLSPSSFHQCSSLSLRLHFSPSLKPVAGLISQEKGTQCPQVGDRHGGTATAACGAPVLKYPSHTEEYLSYPLQRIFPVRFSGPFLRADLNTLRKMIFIILWWIFSVASSLTVTILGDFVRPFLCPGCAISEHLISQSAKIKKEINVHRGPINNSHDWIPADYPLEQYIAGDVLWLRLWLSQLPHSLGLMCSPPCGHCPLWMKLWDLHIPIPCWGLLLGARKGQRNGRGKGKEEEKAFCLSGGGFSPSSHFLQQTPRTNFSKCRQSLPGFSQTFMHLMYANTEQN